MIFSEQKAHEATKRGPFAINITELRSTVTDLLSQFGKFGFFEAYTKHDISHIDEMLISLDWIIPEDTKSRMSFADWFMTVVSIFLHDIGLLITKNEFEKRDQSGFRRFVQTNLYSGDSGSDYKARIELIPESDRDKFLYEEFVRFNHGKRARVWIEGNASSEFGAADAAVDAVNKVLSSLSPQIRADLGVLVESHNLDDLKDRAKYPLERPYANRGEDTANLLYCAILLRTADLFQITSDRAPTRLLKIINPNNPVSQVEWAKQKAVTRVRDQSARNTDGIVDPKLPKDTIAVFANFVERLGFFGLNSYLDYAEKQIVQSYEILDIARTRDGCLHRFPWRKIDREQIEANGFLKKPFRFEIDQEKILNLLTGHVLYNDSLVVVRELAQNALDAVRLYEHQHKAKSSPERFSGKVLVEWNEEERVLQVTDNGTGMSQTVIERHLLKVGSSKYQDASFLKENPHFHAISRFGIGVLSAFMVANEVQILTIEDGDEEAREISLDSVHGHYLIELHKYDSEKVRAIGRHGTRFRLQVRANVKADNLLSSLRRWIMLPGCEFSFVVGGASPVQIGFENTGAALEAMLRSSGYSSAEESEYKIVTEWRDGLEISYALKWLDAFKEFNLFSIGLNRGTNNLPAAALCVHGIAVEFVTPGYQLPVIAALANLSGPKAPKTNVARNSLEENNNTENCIHQFYEIFSHSIKKEIDRLVSEQNYTITKATNESVYMTAPMRAYENGPARYPNNLKAALSTLPIYLFEMGDNEIESRTAISQKELDGISTFWTVESEIVRSAENLLSQFKSDKSVHTAISYLSNRKVVIPGPLLCNLSMLGHLQQAIFDQFEIKKIEMSSEPSQISFLWERSSENLIWTDLMRLINLHGDSRVIDNVTQEISHIFARSSSAFRVLVANNDLQISGAEQYGSVSAYKSLFILPNHPVSSFLISISEEAASHWISLLCYMLVIIRVSGREAIPRDQMQRYLEGKLQRLKAETGIQQLYRSEDFTEVMVAGGLPSYDPFVWSSRGINFGMLDINS